MSIRMKTHGRSRTSIYYIWAGIKKRCFKENDCHYPGWGGRGITMCDRWKNSFELFLEDMGERPSRKHSIERKNNDGNYEPANCIWALPREQARNRRGVHKYLFCDEFLTIPEISELVGIHEDTLRYRLRSGFVLEEAVQKGRVYIRDRK